MQRGNLVWLWLSAVVIALDQWSKAWIEQHFRVFETMPLMPLLAITRAHNNGAAFSFLDGASGWQRWMLTALAVIVSAALIFWLKLMPRRSRLLGAGVALVLGGALGNMIDRLRIGYVVDFVLAHWQQHYFPAFNVADSAITIGAVLLILDTVIDRPRVSER
jgi:signal peptidase II